MEYKVILFLGKINPTCRFFVVVGGFFWGGEFWEFREYREYREAPFPNRPFNFRLIICVGFYENKQNPIYKTTLWS